MARTIIEIEGKKLQVCLSKSNVNPCEGCYFFQGFIGCPGYIPPCFQYDIATGELHILKQI